MIPRPPRFISQAEAQIAVEIAAARIALHEAEEAFEFANTADAKRRALEKINRIQVELGRLFLLEAEEAKRVPEAA